MQVRYTTLADGFNGPFGRGLAGIHVLLFGAVDGRPQLTTISVLLIQLTQRLFACPGLGWVVSMGQQKNELQEPGTEGHHATEP
jgi:hypothetical protein